MHDPHGDDHPPEAPTNAAVGPESGSKEVGADEVWVLTDTGNSAAMALDTATGGREDAPDITMFTDPVDSARGGPARLRKRPLTGRCTGNFTSPRAVSETSLCETGMARVRQHNLSANDQLTFSAQP